MEELNLFGLTVTKEQWVLIQIPSVLLITFIVSLIRSLVFARLTKKFEKVHNLWFISTFEAIGRPLSALIWVTGSLYAVTVLGQEYELTFLEFLPLLSLLIRIGLITWFLLRLIKIFQRNYVKSKKIKGIPLDETTADIIAKILIITVIVFGVLAGMQALKVNVAGLLAFGGVGGIAVAFAAQELIANYFGALMIFMDKPFKIGDRVQSTELDIYGVVEKVGWRQTVIRRIDMRPLYVPNSSFAKISVINNTRQSNRFIFEYVGIRYDDASLLKTIVDDIREMVVNHPEIDPEPRLAVNFDRFAASSLDIMIYCCTRTTNWEKYRHVKQDVLIKAMDIISDHGAEIAFPTSTLHFASPEIQEQYIEQKFQQHEMNFNPAET